MAIVVASLVGVPGVAEADSGPPGSVMSRYETATGAVLERDAGQSSPVPGQPGKSLWVFGDTPIAVNGSVCDTCFIPGSSAAVSTNTPGKVPDGLSELPTPPAAPTLPNSNAPKVFLPNRTDLKLPSGADCGTGGYSASWVSGATPGPDMPLKYNGTSYNAAKLIFLTYGTFCVTKSAMINEGFAATFYDPVANAFVDPSLIFGQAADGSERPWQQNFSSPIFSDGYLYMYATCSPFNCSGGGSTTVVRTPVAKWNSGSSYQWAASASPTGGVTGWTGDPAQAVTVLPGQAALTQVDVKSYPGHGLIMLGQTDFNGAYQEWTASSPAGPWKAGSSGRLGECATYTRSWCYAVTGHPELSTSAGAMVSYLRPDSDRLRMDVIPW
ncbi:hypothetical protein [Actinomadura harenae]|uniref:DUF4185 domain-containing protein n=1 Tax=Actinomadura harenae TaxID=2483351 RepID=A0A3M2MC53_9ACTN|nr:hypothetical protein [Actinomadura harenae]RMI47304.1 hypothetical protein EBO15_03720 [Actinomadura harenae]